MHDNIRRKRKSERENAGPTKRQPMIPIIPGLEIHHTFHREALAQMPFPRVKIARSTLHNPPPERVAQLGQLAAAETSVLQAGRAADERVRGRNAAAATEDRREDHAGGRDVVEAGDCEPRQVSTWH